MVALASSVLVELRQLLLVIILCLVFVCVCVCVCLKGKTPVNCLFHIFEAYCILIFQINYQCVERDVFHFSFSSCIGFVNMAVCLMVCNCLCVWVVRLCF